MSKFIVPHILTAWLPKHGLNCNSTADMLTLLGQITHVQTLPNKELQASS